MSELLTVIRNRHTVHGSFDPSRHITRVQLQLIFEAARWAPTPHNMQNFEIIMVDDKDQLESIAKIPADVSEAFLRETYNQLSFSEDELRIKRTGVLASNFPPAWTSPEAWSPDSDCHYQISFLGRSLGETTTLVIVLYDGARRAPGSDGDVLGHMSLGCVMENMWLMSESLGIEFHVLSVFSNGEVEGKLKNLLQIPSHMKIGFACSLGYGAASLSNYPRVRRELETFVHHNRFGHKDILWSSLEDAETPELIQRSTRV